MKVETVLEKDDNFHSLHYKMFGVVLNNGSVAAVQYATQGVDKIANRVHVSSVPEDATLIYYHGEHESWILGMLFVLTHSQNNIARMSVTELENLTIPKDDVPEHSA